MGTGHCRPRGSVRSCISSAAGIHTAQRAVDSTVSTPRGSRVAVSTAEAAGIRAFRSNPAVVSIPESPLQATPVPHAKVSTAEAAGTRIPRSTVPVTRIAAGPTGEYSRGRRQNVRSRVVRLWILKKTLRIDATSGEKTKCFHGSCHRQPDACEGVTGDGPTRH